MSTLGRIALAFCMLACGCTGLSRQCTVGADCASGICRLDGTCALPSPTPEAGSPIDGGVDAAEVGAPADALPPPPDSGTSCRDDGDWVLGRSEVFFQPGLHEKLLVAENVTVDTGGVMQSDGSRAWDLSAALPGDHVLEVDTQSVAGAWYGPDFPGATYSLQLSDTQPLLGVFTATDSALDLGGVVSPSNGSAQTEVTYAPPASFLNFPLQEGASWTSTSNVTGTAQGVPAAYVDRYDVGVDARGLLVTPLASFRVLRVAVLLTRTVGAAVTVTRSYLFVTDCFATVATVVSQTTSLVNQPPVDFSDAAEVQRLAP